MHVRKKLTKNEKKKIFFTWSMTKNTKKKYRINLGGFPKKLTKRENRDFLQGCINNKNQNTHRKKTNK